MNRARDAREGFAGLIPRYVASPPSSFNSVTHRQAGNIFIPAAGLRCASASAVTVVPPGEENCRLLVNLAAPPRIIALHPSWWAAFKRPSVGFNISRCELASASARRTISFILTLAFGELRSIEVCFEGDDFSKLYRVKLETYSLQKSIFFARRIIIFDGAEGKIDVSLV